VHEISQLHLPLRTDVLSGWDPVRRINEEEHKDFTVAGFLWVDKSEKWDSVLVEVGRAWMPVLIGFWDVLERSHGGFEMLPEIFRELENLISR